MLSRYNDYHVHISIPTKHKNLHNWSWWDYLIVGLLEVLDKLNWILEIPPRLISPWYCKVPSGSSPYFFKILLSLITDRCCPLAGVVWLFYTATGTTTTRSFGKKQTSYTSLHDTLLGSRFLEAPRDSAIPPKISTFPKALKYFVVFLGETVHWPLLP